MLYCFLQTDSSTKKKNTKRSATIWIQHLLNLLDIRNIKISLYLLLIVMQTFSIRSDERHHKTIEFSKFSKTAHSNQKIKVKIDLIADLHTIHNL